MLVAGYEFPLGLLRLELVQLEEEGYIVPEDLKAEVAALPEEMSYSDDLQQYYDRLKDLPRNPEFKFVEPSELDEIKAERPAQIPLPEMKLTDAELQNKLHGAFTGRFVGVALGQVVEGWNMDDITKYLKSVDNYPLTDFIRYRKDTYTGWIATDCPSWKENIKFMGPDDDVNYTLMGLYVLEKYGKDFNWAHVALSWNDCLPYNQICTAETQAVLNFNMYRQRFDVLNTMHVTPQFTRRNNNPYREWIGAQIRADGWAYCSAGNPEQAADYAYRDACWTHEKNGIYGEMFFAAVIAASFVESDLDKLIEIGLSKIPKNCRLAVGIRQAQEWAKTLPDYVAFMQKLQETYPTMHRVHTINNAMICIMSLYYGKMNPDASIAISVMAGLDTDCNGATVGSIVGAVNGYRNFGGILAPQLNDNVRPLMFYFQDTTMNELADRALAVIKK